MPGAVNVNSLKLYLRISPCPIATTAQFTPALTPTLSSQITERNFANDIVRVVAWSATTPKSESCRPRRFDLAR